MTERTKRLLALMVAKPKLRRFSGLPPLTYKAKKAGFLTSYRIYGQTVDGESVGDLVTSGEHAGEYKVPVIIEGKNLLQNIATSLTSRGVTFTVNADGIVTCNGTASNDNNAYLILARTPNFGAGTCILTGCPDGGSVDTYSIQYSNNVNKAFTEIGSGINIYQFSNEMYPGSEVRIRIASGYTCDNLTFYPMIRKADIEDDTYEPYQVPVTTNIYLPYQIRKVGDEAEYIDYGEQKQHRVRKNYLQSSDFEAGAIYTGAPYVDWTYKSSKTPVGVSDFDTTRKRSTNLITIIGTYTISIADGWEFGIIMFPNNKNSGELFIYNTEPVTISNCTFAIQIRKIDISDISSADISDYKIMLNKGSTPLPYEPYIENTDLDVILPALPTVTGTNVLSVGTEVQPSEVDIVGKIIPPASNTLPFPFQSDGKIIKLYSFINDSNNFIGTKTVNPVPDLDGWIMGKALSSYGEVQDNKPTLMISDFIEVEPSTSYKFGAVGKVANDAGSWHRVVYFDENKTNISFVDNNYMNTSFTTPATAKYLRLCTTFWYQPFLVKSSDSYTYVPYGYNIPIVLNNTTYQAYLPEPLGKTLTSEEINNTAAVTFTDGSIYYGDGSGAPTHFTVIGPTNNHYKGYGLVDKAIDKYVLNSYGSTTRVLSPGTYTMCLTVHNPPSTNTWEVDFWANTGSTGTGWRGCRCNSSHVTNNVGKNYATFTVDDTNETQISYAMIRFQNLSEDSEWFQNTVVDIRIIEGTEPVFATRTLVKSNNEIIPLAELPKLTTVSGSNTIDVSTSPKPTVLIKI